MTMNTPTLKTIAHHRAKIDQHLRCIDEITSQLEAKYTPKPVSTTKSKGDTVVVAGITWYLDLLTPEDKSLKGAYYFDETKMWYFEQQVGVDEALRQGKRAPTSDEFQQLYDLTTYKWTKRDGFNGMLFTDKATGNEIFFPATGWYDSTTVGALTNVGSQGIYWSSSISTATLGLPLNFGSRHAYPQDITLRAQGFTLRCVQN